MDKIKLQQDLEHEYLCGLADGRKLLYQQFREAAEKGEVLELGGKLWRLVPCEK